MFTNLKVGIKRQRIAMADRLPMVEVPGQVPTVQVMTGQAPMVRAPMMELNRSYQTQQVSFDPQMQRCKSMQIL